MGFVSFTEITRVGEHRSYNEWHQLDHLPEQYTLAGIALGQKWVSTPACRAARAVSEQPLAPVHYLTVYLMTGPVHTTLEEFAALGRHLRDAGRFHKHRAARLSGPLEPLGAVAAPRVLVSPEAVPFRPNRGVYVSVARVEGAGTIRGLDALCGNRLPELAALPGVAGAWAFGPSEQGRDHPWDPGPHLVTVSYLDADPVECSPLLAAALAQAWEKLPLSPVLVGPFESITPWQWDWFEEARSR